MPSALDYLGITPPGNPLSQFFPQMGGDDAFRSQLEERPVGRNRIPPELALASQLPDPNGFLQQVQQYRGQKEAKKAIGELQNLDFGKPAYAGSVAKLLSKYPNAAQNPAVQKILQLKEFSGRQAADTKYSSAAAQAAKDLLSIPEDSRDYDERYQKLISGLDPEVLTHPRFASFAERGMHNSAMVRSKRTADQQVNQMLNRELTKNGLKPSSYSSTEDKQDALAQYMGKQAQRKEIQDAFKTDPKLRDKFVDSFMAINSPITDEEKISEAGKTKASEMTPQDWTSSHSRIHQRRIRDLNNVNATFMAMGLAPNQFGGPSGASEGGSSTVTPPMGSNAPTVVSGQSGALPAEQPLVSPIVIPTASVSPADLTRGEVYDLPQNLEQRIAAENATAQNQLVLTAQQKQAEVDAQKQAIAQRGQEVTQMAPAWQTLMQIMSPSDLDRPISDFADDTFLGDKKINPQTVLFKDAKGRPVFMRDAIREFRMSPKFDELQKSRGSITPITAARITSVVPVK